MKGFNVRFILPGSTKEAAVAGGTDLLSAAMKAGIVISASCGGEGLCGKCKVIIGQKKVLACETIVEHDLEVTIPRESLEIHEKGAAESEEFTKGVVLKRENAYPYFPLVTKVYLKLAAPTADDNVSDLDRICRELGKKVDSLHISTKLANVKFLSETLRDSDFEITVVLGYKEGGFSIIAVEPGDTTGRNYGFAFDIGTTTVVGQLIDLNSREILGTRIAFNKQASYGSDVITRIVFASAPEGLEKSHKAVTSNMNEMIDDLTGACGVNLGDIYAITCAGNMTMMHLLLKIDPSAIRKPPYIPTTTAFPAIHSSEAGIDANPKSLVSFLPGVGTYVGGDIVAGVLACGLFENDGLSLLIDIGTNGEIVLGNRDWMMGAAASAGPAFEGSGLSCGMKAVRGAIQKVDIDAGLNVKCDIIGGSKALGVCGSGYIDLLCQMLKRGIIDKAGKIDMNIKSSRARRGENVNEFVLAFKSETDAGKDIIITEDDIENLKRSKGAIYSAIISLLAKVGKDINEVAKIYIAGGFGNYLNIENAVSIGLLPDVKRGVYEFIGNSSLAGARMSLLSKEAFMVADGIAKSITYIDLSAEPTYMDEYVASLFFPHTNLRRFPSVRS
ncbi:MAG: ASKHA domain-containing protein [Candidatus Omnitrophica bacterium]|nr:ASKHA domain-containing protein [Candidatus Omnitrophota bacterium]